MVKVTYTQYHSPDGWQVSSAAAGDLQPETTKDCPGGEVVAGRKARAHRKSAVPTQDTGAGEQEGLW